MPWVGERLEMCAGLKGSGLWLPGRLLHPPRPRERPEEGLRDWVEGGLRLGKEAEPSRSGLSFELLEIWLCPGIKRNPGVPTSKDK